jgi:integrase
VQNGFPAVLSWQTPPQGYVRTGSRSLSFSSGDVAKRGSIHAVAGAFDVLFLYREVLGIELPGLENVTRAKKPQRLPVVLTVQEVKGVLAQLDGRNWAMASLLSGSGLRLMACVRLRVKDVDFAMRQIVVRDGKGAKDRVMMLPDSPVEPLKPYLEKVRTVHGKGLPGEMCIHRLPGNASIEGTFQALRQGCPEHRLRPQDIPVEGFRANGLFG